MRNLIDAAYVIGRRDFVATVYSKAFLLFLVGPLLFILLSFTFGNLADRMAREDLRATVAVIAGDADYKAIEAARGRLSPGFGEDGLFDLVRAEPDYVIDRQVQNLLASKDKRIVAVLTGGIAAPRLTGAIREDGSVRRQMALILDEARQQRALDGARLSLAPVDIALVRLEDSAASRAATRSVTARIGQVTLFTLTLMLATMLLSNLVEEKSNKVIETLAAAVPVNAIFVGKLFSMLAVSFVGIAVWAAATIAGLLVWPPAEAFAEPAVGWPLFSVLVIVYYSANYLLLGAIFLGIGAQASSIREIQTLSMPVTIGQMLLLFFALTAVGPYNGLLGIAAAVFPFSSPLAMIARAAQTPEIWPHLLAILWQALWIWLTIRLAASLFRRNVMKSGAPDEAKARKARPAWLGLGGGA